LQVGPDILSPSLLRDNHLRAIINVFYLGNPTRIPRVLEVVKSQLCWVVGTVYMDMPLKPNVLEDIARDVSPGSFPLYLTTLTMISYIALNSSPSPSQKILLTGRQRDA
jgi:hypothetical protein